MRKIKIASALVGVLMSLSIFGSSVGAADLQPTIDQQKKERAEEVLQWLSDYNSKKIRIKALEEQLNNQQEQMGTLSSAQSSAASEELNHLKEDVAYTEENFEELSGLVKVNPEDYGVELNIAASDGTVEFEGTMYYDSLFVNAFIVNVDYEWIDTQYYNQKNGNGDVGGYDGFSIGLNKPILTVSETANVYDHHFGEIQDDVTFYQSYSTHGRGWRWQDEIITGMYGTDNYNSHYGIFDLYFEFDDEPSDGDRTQYYGSYAHTWDETSINSIGVGPYSASIGWSNAGSEWEDADQWIYTH